MPNQVLRPTRSASSGGVTNRYLVIVVPKGRAIRQRQPFWKRALMLPLGEGIPLRLTIWQGLLDVPASELATQIDHYVRTHAPPGWLDVDDDQEENQSGQP